MVSESLERKRCRPCEKGTPPFSTDEVAKWLPGVPGWELASNGARLCRELRWKSFREAIAFVNRVAEIAEKEDHHPDIHIHYNRVRLEVWTHVIGGLSENDFILAAKIEAEGK